MALPKLIPAAFLILCTVISMPLHAADVAPVSAARNGNSFTLENGLFAVAVDPASGTFTAASKGAPFIREGKLPGGAGEGAVQGIQQPIGAGKSVEITRPDGSRDRISLYGGVPFVFLQHRIANATPRPVVIDKLTPVRFTLAPGKALADLRVLGCDGLTPATDRRASYAFLAAAAPATRAGVVAGWLTNDRASGIVTAEPAEDANALVIQGRSEYGKLTLKPAADDGSTFTEGETFVIGKFDDALLGLEAYADAVARHHGVKLKPIPSGYCTWYSRPHGGAADEKSLAELATFAKQKLAPFGFNLVQIDDKWQILGRDYTAHKPTGPYPAGMKSTADALRAQGMTAGIWFIPFGWDPKSPTFARHQDYFVKRADGAPYEVKWAGTCLDMTHPGARELLRQTVSRMTRDWGYKYLKIDGLWTGMATQILYPNPAVRDDKLGDAVFHDPTKTNIEAFRDGLRVVRDAAGDDVFVTGCNIAQNMRTLAGSYGLVDAMRVGRDIGASWEKILPSMTMGTRLYFYHGRVWHNDPDCLMLRSPLSLDQARSWGSWIALSGQLNLVSEWLPGLPDDRLEVVRRTMPNTGLCGRPVDLFRHNDPRVWRLTAGTGPSRRDVVGLFNWDDKKSATVRASFEELGLPPENRAYAGFDYWNDRFVGPFEGSIEFELQPASCRVISLRPVATHPQVVGTSRHVTQGVIDLSEEKWDPATRTLSGASKVVGGDAYQIRVAAPGDLRVTSATADGDVTVTIDDGGRNARVTIRSDTSREVRWRLIY